MPQARHARPAEPRRVRSAPRQGRHRATSRSASPVRPAVFGVAALAVASGGIGLQVFPWEPSTQADAANLASAVAVPPAAVDAPVGATARASRSHERARIRARQRALEAELKAARERRLRLEQQVCRRTAETLAGLELDSEQQRNLRIITNVARRLGLPPRAAVIAAATAWQETRLRNLSYGMGDSVGLFQQRPSMGWGSVAQLTDPHYAARKFYEGLVEVRGWRRLSIGVAAQAVQRSAYPSRYAQWTGVARVGVRGLEAARAAGATC